MNRKAELAEVPIAADLRPPTHVREAIETEQGWDVFHSIRWAAVMGMAGHVERRRCLEEIVRVANEALRT